MKRMKRILVFFAAFLAVPFLAGAAHHTLGSLASHDGYATNALRCASGDSVTLPAYPSVEDPELESYFYVVNNTRVATLGADGFTLATREGGFTGVRLQKITGSATNTAATCGLVVVPERIGNGRVFLLNSKRYDNGTTTQNFTWESAASWVCLAGEPGDYPYPHEQGDIAMVVGWKIDSIYSNTSISLSQAKNKGVSSMAALYFGSLDAVTSIMNWNGCADATSSYRLKRTDGKPCEIIFTGGSGSLNTVWNYVRCGNVSTARNRTELTGSLTVDMGWTGSESLRNCGGLYWRYADLNVPAGETLKFVKGCYRGTGSSPGWGIGLNMEINGGAGDMNLTGSGVVFNDSSMAMKVALKDGGDHFTGEYWACGDTYTSHIPTATPGDASGSAELDFAYQCATGRTVRLFGYNTQWRSGWNSFAWGCPGAGFAKLGYQSTSWAYTFPRGSAVKGDLTQAERIGELVMNGGTFSSFAEWKWGEDGVVTTQVSRLTLERGECEIFVNGLSDSTAPTNYLLFPVTVHKNRAQLLLFERNMWDSTTARKIRVEFSDFASHAIGGIVPWISGTDRTTGAFLPTVNGEGYLCHTAFMKNLADAAATDNVSTANANTYNLSVDATVNSLMIFNNATDGGVANIHHLGAGRTLTVTSGALCGSGRFGKATTGTENGTVSFPNTAYLSGTTMYMYTPMVAPEGVAAGFSGSLTLTGDQTGIKKELVVNNGTLKLGTATLPAQLSVPIRLVSANAKLEVVNANTDFLRHASLTFDDVMQHHPKLQLPDGSTYFCKALYVGGRLMRGGTYGSSSSAADYQDDTHFTGTGVLDVLAAGTVVFVK